MNVTRYAQFTLFLHRIRIYCLAIFAILTSCAPNYYSFANAHSLAIQAKRHGGGIGGIGFDGPERLTYSKTYTDSFNYGPDRQGVSVYTQKIGTGFGPYLHTVIFNAMLDSSTFTRSLIPLHIGQMPSLSFGFLKGDFCIQGIARSAILQSGVGLGVTYNLISTLVIGGGAEYRQEYSGIPESGTFVYGGLFGRNPGFIFRPTAQADYSFVIPKTRIVSSIGGMIAVMHSFDIQFSGTINY